DVPITASEVRFKPTARPDLPPRFSSQHSKTGCATAGGDPDGGGELWQVASSGRLLWKNALEHSDHRLFFGSGRSRYIHGLCSADSVASFHPHLRRARR
ncbi:unnamed protein product, partial [Symbiodinium pilosum]